MTDDEINEKFLKFSRKFSVLSVFVYQDCVLLTFFIALASNIFTLSSSTPLTTEIYESDSNPHEQQKHTNQQTQKKLNWQQPLTE